MPKVSVILPTYHHCETVGRAVQSVLDQTYRDFELIIIDDGSTDGTSEILNHFKWADDRVTVYRNEQNSGCPARVCNEAVKKYASGEYIAFQFDDDFWFEWCLESLVNGSPGFDFVYGQTVYINFATKRLEGILGNIKIDKSNILERNRLANNAVLIKRSVFLELGGFDESPLIKRVCDWELWTRLVYHDYKINNIPQLISICYAFRPHSVGVLFDFDQKTIKKYIADKLNKLGLKGL